MHKFEQLMEKLDELDVIQKSVLWEEDIPEDIWIEYFDDYEVLEEGLYVDTHRWYELSTTVIDVCGGLLGIEHISNMFSEASLFEDCCHTLKFYEMEEYTTVSYRMKEGK